MNLRDAAWRTPPDFDYREVSKDYPLSTVLPRANKSKRGLNYTTIVGIAAAVFYGLFYLLFR